MEDPKSLFSKGPGSYNCQACFLLGLAYGPHYDTFDLSEKDAGVLNEISRLVAEREEQAREIKNRVNKEELLEAAIKIVALHDDFGNKV